MRRGYGKPTQKLIERIRKILQKDNLIQIIDEIWITSVSGYYLSQDVMRWEGQVRGILNDRPITYTIESWEKVKDCNCNDLHYTRDSYTCLEFHSGK